jgi:hypothetical protein
MTESINQDFLWLLSPDAEKLLRLAEDDFVAQTSPLKIAKQLRKSTSPARSALVMEQAQLRIRARTKFSLADRMFFTQRGLEQSSGLEIARYKANRFENSLAVADICCGIGGDLISLALRSTQHATCQTLGVDSDPVTAMFAQHNLNVHLDDASSATTRNANVRQCEFADCDLSDFDAVHLDPDRRKGRRTTDGSHFSPSLTDIYDRITAEQTIAIKVAPATPHRPYFPPEVHREWIGSRRECKQQILWTGPQQDLPGGKTATIVTADGTAHSISTPASQAPERVVCEQLDKYLYEPNSTVLAAGLTDSLADRFQLKRIAYEIPYLVSDTLIDNPMLSKFEIIEILRLDYKQVLSFLNVNNVGEIELKQRGIDNVTYDRFRRIKLKGEKKATIILTRCGKQHKRRAIVAKRLR